MEFSLKDKLLLGWLGAILIAAPVVGQSSSCDPKKVESVLRERTVPWNRRIGFRETEKTLANGKVVSIRTLEDAHKAAGKVLSGTHDVFVVTYEDGTRAIWKASENGSADAEVDAYRGARLVGSRQVPPTVKRKLTSADVDVSRIAPEVWDQVKDRTGSAQFYVESPFDIKSKDPLAKEALARVSPKDASDRKIFYFVFGQWDAHPGNMIIDGTSTIALIDNTHVQDFQKVRYGELPFKRSFELLPAARTPLEREPATFPFDRAKLLKNPTKEEFTRFLNGKVDPKRIESFWEWRIKNTDKTMNVVIWRNRYWIQGIGFQNYGPMVPEVFSEKTLEGYRALTRDSLRQALSPQMTEEHIQDILERRDQLLKAAQTGTKIP